MMILSRCIPVVFVIEEEEWETWVRKHKEYLD